MHLHPWTQKIDIKCQSWLWCVEMSIWIQLLKEQNHSLRKSFVQCCPTCVIYLETFQEFGETCSFEFELEPLTCWVPMAASMTHSLSLSQFWLHARLWLLVHTNVISEACQPIPTCVWPQAFGEQHGECLHWNDWLFVTSTELMLLAS